MSAPRRRDDRTGQVVPFQRTARPDAPPRVASSRPDLMQPPFDLQHELIVNRDYYFGSEWVAIQSMPSYLRTCLERVTIAVGKADQRPRPGISPVVAACVTHGLELIRSHEHVAAVFEIRDRLHSATRINSEESEELAVWLRTFPLSLPDTSTTGQRRLNITLPPYTKVALSELSNELGVSVSNLIVLCCSITLSDQLMILEDRRKDLSNVVEKFFRRLAIRRDVSEGWFKRISQ